MNDNTIDYNPSYSNDVGSVVDNYTDNIERVITKANTDNSPILDVSNNNSNGSSNGNSNNNTGCNNISND